MSNRLNQDNLRTWQCGCLDNGGVLAADGRKARQYAEQLDRIEGVCERTWERWQRQGVPKEQAIEFLGAVLGIIRSGQP